MKKKTSEYQNKTLSPTALITGATGFIGSHLATTLSQKKWNLTCLIRPSSKTDVLSRLPVTLLKGHISDISFLEQSVKGKDYIFHLAAALRSKKKSEYENVNYQFTKNLAECCMRVNPTVKRFVYISSIAAAGHSEREIPSNEKRLCNPTSEYGKTKLLGEEAVKKVWDKIQATIIRPPNVYGIRQKETELLIKLIKKRVIPILSEGMGKTSIIYINDLVEGIIKSALSSVCQKQIYYLTDGFSYSWKEILSTLKDEILHDSKYVAIKENTILFLLSFADFLKKTGLIKTKYTHKSWNAIKDTSWLFSSEKAEHDFGFNPDYNLKLGIQETLSLLYPNRKSF